MTNYYYSENPEVTHQERHWNFELLGNNFQFTTDNGVFSKRTVDFGSRTLLKALAQKDQLTGIKGKILDVGCGYGPIGLALAKKHSQLQVDMVDVNELALSLARQNAIANKVQNVNIFTSNIYQNIKDDDYTMIMSNPPIRAGKKIVYEILTCAYAHLAINGFLTVVIQKKQGAPSVKKKMTETFDNCKMIFRNKGYQVLQSQKVN